MDTEIPRLHDVLILNGPFSGLFYFLTCTSTMQCQLLERMGAQGNAEGGHRNV